MGAIIVTEFLTIDGIMEAPERWVFPFINKEIERLKLDEMASAEALLLGNVTYNVFAASWPSRTGELAEKMNAARKDVVSSSREVPRWNNAYVLNDDIVDAVSGFKKARGKDTIIAGSATLVQSLMRHDLVDEYRLLICPVVLGAGTRLFREGAAADLRHIGTTTYDTGAVLLRYRPVRCNGAVKRQS
jgi:dihydrofolate reductase